MKAKKLAKILLKNPEAKVTLSVSDENLHFFADEIIEVTIQGEKQLTIVADINRNDDWFNPSEDFKAKEKKKLTPEELFNEWWSNEIDYGEHEFTEKERVAAYHGFMVGYDKKAREGKPVADTEKGESKFFCASKSICPYKNGYNECENTEDCFFKEKEFT